MTEQLNKALIAAQKEFPTIAKTKTANMQTYSYKYADLGDVMDAVLPILHKHGLALVQPPLSRDGMVGCKTTLLHESGAFVEMGELLLPSGGTPQNAGSAMTYARRYAACSALGIVADEDVDGAQAPQVDGSEWLANSVQMFTEWTEEQRRETAAQVAHEVGAKKPISIDEARQVFEKMKAIYLETTDAKEEGAPF